MPASRFLLAVCLVTCTVAAHAAATDCSAMTTVDMTQCESERGELLDQQLASYLRVAQSIIDEGDSSNGALDRMTLDLSAAQTAWLGYRAAQCGDVYLYWRRGTIRYHESAICTMALTRERLHDVWRDYLSRGGGRQPILPEPCTLASGCTLPDAKEEAVRQQHNAALARIAPPGERREILYAPMPVMPQSLVEEQDTGRVFAQLQVEPEGGVSHVEVLETSDSRLSEAVTEAVRWWRFGPNPGRTTPYDIRQEFNFKTGR